MQLLMKRERERDIDREREREMPGGKSKESGEAGRGPSQLAGICPAVGQEKPYKCRIYQGH